MITGVNGWLGKRLLKRVLALRDDPNSAYFGCLMRALVLPAEDKLWLLNLEVEVFLGDVSDIAACERLTLGGERGLVLHLAGVIHPRTVREFDSVNVKGTFNILSASSRAGVTRMVMMSSSAVYGAVGKPDELLTERSETSPEGAYGRSKVRAEGLLRRAFGSLEGPSITIIRAPWFYGPGQPDRQTRFFEMVQHGVFPIAHHGNNKRSLAYVDNLADGIALAAACEAAVDKTYLMADERPYTMREILITLRDLMENEFGFKVRSHSFNLPTGVLKIAAAANLAVQNLGWYSQRLQVAAELGVSLPFDVDKAKTELGYLPNQDLREGMRQSILWCIEHGSLDPKS